MAFIGGKGEVAKEGKFRTRIKKEKGNKFWEEGKYLVPKGYDKKDIPEKKECCPFALTKDCAHKRQEIPRWSQHGY